MIIRNRESKVRADRRRLGGGIGGGEVREEGSGRERGENKKHGDTEDNRQRGKQLEEPKVTRKENKEKGKKLEIHGER